VTSRPVAVVTGGSRGIGRAFVREAARRGHFVVVGYSSNQAEADAAVEEVRAAGSNGVAIGGDLSDIHAVEGLAAAAREAGPVNLLVNNAGLTLSGPLEGLDVTTWDYGIALNLTAPMWLAVCLVPELRANGGSILNVASTGGVIGSTHSLIYGASKAGLIGLTKTMARMLAPEVRVNAICPGPIATGLLDNIEQDTMAAILAGTPLGRLGTPEEIAVAGMDICQWTYCTGQTIVVDGGRVML
jgi:3-oxoacyl-[acyl-carrier protein] reductase